MEYVTLRDIAALNEDEDLKLWFGQFLDDFRHAEDKYALIKDEPIWSRENPDWMYYQLAAAAHKLANDNGLPIPNWAMNKKYVSPIPIYGMNTKNVEFQLLLEKTSPIEYKQRNIFFGENVLSRA